MAFWKNRRVMVTGGEGFLGRTLVRKIKEMKGIIFIPRTEEFDLTKEGNVDKVFSKFKPDLVLHLAADLGGIGYIRSNPGKIYFNNTIMNTFLMEKARRYNIRKFIGINTVNCYPENARIPLKENRLWNGRPEKSIAAYGLSKRMMIFQSEVYREQYDFNSINLILDSIYGPFDNFDLNTSRVIPGTIRKCIEAKEKNENRIVAWGTGEAIREFLYVEDAVEAIVIATEKYEKPEPINIGSGFQIKIKNLVELIAELSRFKGEIIWDTAKPDGQMERVMDTSRARKEFEFEAKIGFEEGLQKTIDWYCSNIAISKRKSKLKSY